MPRPRVNIRHYDRVIEAGKPWLLVIEDPNNRTVITIEKTADDSLHVEIDTPEGADRSGVRRPLEVRGAAPAPPSPPPPPPPPPDTSPGAICSRIWLEELERPIDPAGLADCVVQLRAGKSPDAIREGVRQSPEYAELQERKKSRVAGRVRAERRLLFNDAGIFRGRFVSGFTLTTMDRGAAREYIEWAARTGFNGVRVLCGNLTWAGQTAAAAAEGLPWVLDTLAANGLYCEVTALTDTAASNFDLRAHVDTIARICAERENAIVEIANEPYHPTQREDVHEYDFLGRLGRDLVEPRGLLWSVGAPPDDEPQAKELPLAGRYLHIHLNRGRDEWNMVRRVRELEAASHNYGRHVWNGEPIGWADTNQPGRRSANPDIAFTMGLLSRGFEVSVTSHAEHALTAVLPSPHQQHMHDRLVAGFAAIPTDAPLAFKNARWSDSPVEEAAFERTVVRVYSFMDSTDHGYTFAFGMSGDPGIQWRNGFRDTARLVDTPTMRLMEVSKR
jgi:hypothetical protein